MSVREYDRKMVQDLEQMGFDVQVTFQCNFEAVKFVSRQIMRCTRHKITADLKQYIPEAEKYMAFFKQEPKRQFNDSMYVDESNMQSNILTGNVFGYAQVDVETRPEFRDKYSDFPPIIKNTMIGIDDVGKYMASIAKETGQLKAPRKALIGSYWAKNIWLMTPMIQFLASHGVEVQKVHSVAQFDKAIPFKWFGEEVTKHRRLGDLDPETMGLLAELFKLLGNAAYGKTITNIRSHQDVFYCDKAKASECHGDPYHHRTIVVVPNEVYEVHMRKAKISFNLPMTIGLGVYSWAKQRVLSFVYDVLLEYLDRTRWMLVESDTDSIYLAINAETLDEIVIPPKREAFNAIKHLWFADEEKNPLSKREPGLFKIEKTGFYFIGLSAKCYILTDHEEAKPSVRAKGVQLNRNTEALCYANYKKILFGDPEAMRAVHNIGIRAADGCVKTYIQEKTGLGRLNVKRIYNEDGSSVPLNL